MNTYIALQDKRNNKIHIGKAIPIEHATYGCLIVRDVPGIFDGGQFDGPEHVTDDTVIDDCERVWLLVDPEGQEVRVSAETWESIGPDEGNLAEHLMVAREDGGVPSPSLQAWADWRW